MYRVVFILLLSLFCCWSCRSPRAASFPVSDPQRPVRPGADQMDLYLPYLEGKRVGVFANQTSRVGSSHLIDTLKKSGVDIRVIFGPEHGFRGDADAGEKVGNYTDASTGIPVVSLYGSKKAPDEKDLASVDVLLFDIQDVGTRFYTYISSLEDFMVAAIQYRKPLIILDRPNPNGHYVDGPVLQAKYRSFVGMQEIPVVYGMTIGEYAGYLIGEKKLAAAREKFIPFLRDGININAYPSPPHIEIRVIRCNNYDHQRLYELPVKPSPNLPTMQSIYWYPTTCFFEGTVLSEGRGTDKPFQVFGHPDLPDSLYSFTPAPTAGAKNSKHFGKRCFGWDLSGTKEEVLLKVDNQIQLTWLLEAYRQFPKKDSFFLLPKSGKMEESFFNKLAGNNELWQQIRAGKTEAEIRASWEPALREFRKIRKKYLLYAE